MVDVSDEPTCDVVMKGGISSGVVYPRAVCDLAEEYRLVNIGGASAGAIAAAVAAAAEYGRQHPPRGGRAGFAVLADLPARLGTTTNGATALVTLFEPQPATRPLMRVLRAAVSAPRGRVVRTAATAFGAELGSSAGWWRVVVGGLPGLAVLLVAALATEPPWSVVLAVIGLALLLVGLLTGTVWAVARRLLVEVPRNHLGVVNGMGGPTALTPWLTDLIDEAAGRVGGPPLTMADLWGASDDEAKVACRHNPDQRRINLEVMTTNLGEARPMRLPLLSEEYFFAEAEFASLFPERVVDAMAAASHPGRRTEREQQEFDIVTRLAAAAGYRRMPVADLPVVVAARLSLSFPVLLSAVPLYKIDFVRPGFGKALDQWAAWLREHPGADPADADAAARRAGELLPLARCWISDGGITSNMPLHFFDSALPRRPTFVVNLRYRHRPGGPDDPRVVLAENNQQGRLGVATDLGQRPSLPAFGSAIVSTMQNWVDNAQMRMPGYRDRIVTVYLDPGEGGMNLEMDEAQIGALTGYGRCAAEKLVTRFVDGDGWANQRWVRCRTLMAVLEQLFGHVHEAWGADPVMGAPGYGAMLDDPDVRPPGYRIDARSQRWVQTRARAFAALAGEWPEPVAVDATTTSVGRFTHRQPRPRAEWRAQPRL